MKPGDSSPWQDANDEITALIRTLHDTEQRLEELTAGEVDTVAADDGQTYMLRRAQDDLRSQEAVRQAAILDALPTHIALLDPSGFILSVNEAWRHFAQTNGFQGAEYGLGLNYLDLCDRALGEDASEARQVAAGIRSVLVGGAKSFSIEYPCHSPTEKRWFLMTATPLAGDPPQGVVVMHFNITERKRGEDDLHRFGVAMNAIADGVFLISRTSMHYVEVNASACKMLGYTREELLQIGPNVIGPATLEELAKLYDAIIATPHKNEITETQLQRKDGSRFPVEVCRNAVRTTSDWIIVIVARDITERKRAKAELEKSEDRFKLLVENSGVGIYQTTPDGQILLANPALCQMLGYASFEELRNRNLEDNGYHSDFPRSQFKKTLEETGRIFGLESRWTRADGEMIFLRESARVVRDTNGKVLYYEGFVEDFTERKQTVETLRRTAEEFRTLAEAMPQIVWITRPDGWNIFFNQRWMDYTGLTLEESLGHGWNKPFHPEDQQRAWDAWQKATAGKGIYSIESRLRRADGVYRWWLVRGVPMKDAAGAIVKWFGTCTDIHDLKIAELEIAQTNRILRESERRFSSFMANVDLISMMLDRKGIITYCNDYLLKLSGWQREEVLGRDWFELFVPPELGDMKRTLFASLLVDQPNSWHHENEILMRSGERRLIRFNNSVLKSETGEATGTASIGEDITEQRRAEVELTKLRKAIDASGEAVYLTDREGIFTYVNPGFTALYGYALSEVVGRVTPRILTSGLTPASVYEAFWKALLSGQEIRKELKNKKKDGTIIDVEGSATAIFDEKGKIAGFLGIQRDVTERKQAAEIILNLNEELEGKVVARTLDLEQARREADLANQAKSVFLSTMSHEIRTPMNGVIGMVEALQQTSLNRHQVEMVDLIRESSFSLLSIIEDILDFSKIEAGKLEIERLPILLADVIDKTCGMLEHLAEKKGVELSLFLDPKIPERVLGDALRLRQILVNLVSNAIKFSSLMQGHGRVSVRVTLAAATSEMVMLDFQVADNGIGMDEASQSKLFKPFTQAEISTTRRFGGTGLGLAITRNLVALKGGEISVRSMLGKGSTFTVRLPFEPLPAEVDPSDTGSPIAGLSCLIVGDPEGSAGDLASYLFSTGALVEHVVDMKTAEERIGLLSPGQWVWILDTGIEPPLPEGLRTALEARSDITCGFVFIGRGSRRRRRHPRLESIGIVSVDGHLLTRRTLLKAVAIAAGRAAEEQEYPRPNQQEMGISLPSREEAMRRERLILVAEDNEINQKVILQQLGMLGFAADLAKDGFDALTHWSSGQYALLLTDLNMPGMDGYELTAAIRDAEKGSRHAPIVALTANAIQGEAQRCREAGMDDYLSKPTKLKDLQAMLERWLPTSELGPQLPDPEAPPVAVTELVDLSALKALVRDDPMLLQEFIEVFRTGAAKTSAALQAACETGTAQQAGALAHKLKGSALSIGAGALGEWCAEMEQAGKAGQMETLKAMWPRFEAEMAAVNEYLSSWLKPATDTKE